MSKKFQLAGIYQPKSTPSTSKTTFPAQNYDLLISKNTVPLPTWSNQINKALIKVKAVGINPVDTKIIKPFGRASAPVLRDFSGVVEAINAQNKHISRNLQPGDEVMGSLFNLFGGALTEQILVDLDQITKKPKNVSFEQAAGVGVVYATGYDGIFAETPAAKNHNRPAANENSSILIIGASGGTGIAGVQLAKHCAKAKLIVGICSGKNAEFVKNCGADYVIDYTKIDFSEKNKNLLVDIKQQINGKNEDEYLSKVLDEGFDLIYDCVSSPEDFNYRPVCSNILKAKNGHYMCINSKTPSMWVSAVLTNSTKLSWFLPKNQDLFFPTMTGDKLDIMSQWFSEEKLNVHLAAVFDWKTGREVNVSDDERGNFTESDISNTPILVNGLVSLNEVIERQCSRRAVGKIVITNINA